ncbi:competence/damage-inducible protein A [Alkalihalobacillus sp. 1P02AB]|uniref:competence/damage-inducible protein A n=1 Tax=Alkalihalobacillus sp. 1P02AB TaxID=3132260 RepID=UPI0039A6E23E
MRAEILAVGSELLLGQILNTNAKFISEQLAILGIDVYYQTVVGDNENRLYDSLGLASQRSDIVILTGGLGPTKDDLTKETVAKLFQAKLVYDKNALFSIEQYFSKRQMKMTENNKKQALILEGAEVLVNRNGMAPGMLLKKDKKMVILLPGPPKEMEPMFVKELIPLLEKSLLNRGKITSRVLRFFNIGESALETRLETLIDNQTNPTIAPLAGNGEVTLRLTVKHEDDGEAIRLLDATEKEIQAIVGDYFYGYDHTSLMEQVVQQLTKEKWTISCAESLTGGMFASELTSFSGVSEIFTGGTVAYSTKEKEKQLQVSKEVIKQDGVVSESCAKEMALGAKKLYESDIAISFTGVAGPDKQEGKDPGVVYISIVGKSGVANGYTLSLHGSRNAIRDRAVKYGCYYLLNEMKRWKSSNDIF